ncbi:hypothetical protein PLICRDRAFT_45401 [Plicaturopsis crispa FD-325 SS-3]|uniref:Unplaced genomic scaffold PLICRscaffold_15, whole genome shotgun sequence n=1 Tax=Plicaturopsis crispa FD-325 SS-3 TaxID=944288 RepID=A0A0C9SYS4_PLICR|nr:hypothetical protein PLICRDRAFT_45401 [Plicaturopsis crispa FD-325 SS-3]
MATASGSQSVLDIEQKIAIAKQKKDTADQSFKANNSKDALRAYHEALMYLIGIDKNAMKSMGMSQPVDESAKNKEEKTEVDEIVEKIYANMSACHLKNGNYQRALETANKALAKNEANYKAMFRKGKALGELGYFEKAQKVLDELVSKNPDDAVIVTAELNRLRAIDREREKAQNKKLKGFLTKEKKPAPTAASEPVPTP